MWHKATYLHNTNLSIQGVRKFEGVREKNNVTRLYIIIFSKTFFVSVIAITYKNIQDVICKLELSWGPLNLPDI